ncbi:SH2 domain and PTB/PI domain and Pleckstrin homology-like domain and Tensin phosphotyrosine-binding domain and Tensin phosphatase, C2 domain-containing protein [Strongyloides ratti]|uniref:SH2 domain and PTB/PI domain and Pleckstrin homology-like domain and Tensin phosphotyrosine-binding domain and Tensin phosphatase, C2 domain-containing protein n=1 Tax=Strongyloides ratti TaxID=34506 RepID=A0A090LLB8_STRRB|nr:SH2 domain and PTB/PI domain and Pleckstrin homology-like domain and Tensin phosphotyrosine-binding domain and Tensin phosphatase, C2 domain-containing protein [Strongyloides ratti]CEF68330.1 SH2 domain and PTB/PI domain and Pleckstrin homology-like domain and Tensin phosphotyrosine-binding domain and Tensin phosphatase, C2 domain-containing protein [Strongyloides ratti]
MVNFLSKSLFCLSPATTNKGGKMNEVDSYVGSPATNKNFRSTSLKRIFFPTSDNNIMEPASYSGPNDRVEITEITKRIFAWTFPKHGSDSSYRQSIKEVSESFKKKYREKYKVINVSQKRSDLGRSNPNVLEFGWPDKLAPPLDRLCSICKQIENHLKGSDDNIIVIHCKGWRSRASIVIAAYMHYNSICSSNDDVGDRFSMQLYSEKYIGGDGQPSHKRYIKYFANLLSGHTKVNQQPIMLNQIILKKLPKNNILIKIYERMKPVYNSYQTISKEEICINIDGGLSLRGDILLKCFEINENGDEKKERNLLLQCQFNTCAIDFKEINNKLRFYKEELDFAFMDSSVNNQSYLEFCFTEKNNKENSNNSLNRRKQSFSEFSRADSYENFDRPEDDRSQSIDPLYSEINKSSITQNNITITNNNSNNLLPSPIDGTDSGIGSDSPKNMAKVPPHVPPKPNKSSINQDDAGRKSTIPEENHITREHSALPASVRKSVSRPSSPYNGNGDINQCNGGSITGGRQTPSFEPDLVGKDRYDKNSKCFSYVPAKALNEHFTMPKKAPSQRRLSMEKIDLEVPETPELQEKLKHIRLKSTDVERVPEPPKWEEEIDALANINGGFNFEKRSQSTVPRSYTPHDFRDLIDIATPINNDLSRNYNNTYRSIDIPYEDSSSMNSSTLQYNSGNYPYSKNNIPEQPIVHDQAMKIISTTNPKRYNSYKTLNDDTCNSEMEELCDPDYYLSGTGVNKSILKNKKNNHTESNNKYLNQNLNKKELDEMDYLVESTITPPNRTCYTPKPIPSWKMSTTDNHIDNFGSPKMKHDDFRYRNCKSVAASPIISNHNNRKLFSNHRYDPTDDAESPDKWLENKLKQLKFKRQSQPDLTFRKKTEKILLDELKNTNNITGRGKNEESYTYEGQGHNDLLEDYKYEEERLKNTKSPYFDDFSSIKSTYNNNTPSRYTSYGESNYGSRPQSRNSRPSSTLNHINTPKGKPPTPPPIRDRSRSPAKSPIIGRNRLTLVRDQPSPYQLERKNINSRSLLQTNSNQKPFDYSSDESDNNSIEQGEFSHLRSIVETNNSRPNSRASQVKNYNSRSNVNTPTLGREDYNKNLFENHTSNLIAGSVSGQRSETPAFPVNTSQTPLPYHPLLYNTNGHNLGFNDTNNMTSLTYRSPSLRSQVYSNGSTYNYNRPTSIIVQKDNYQNKKPTTSCAPIAKEEFEDNDDEGNFNDIESSLKSSTSLTSSSNSLNRSNNIPSSSLNICKNNNKKDEGISEINSISFHHSQAQEYYSYMSETMSPKTISRIKHFNVIIENENNGEVISHHPIFVKDTSKYWYKPKISREDAINMLKNKPPGTFVIRDSNSFPGAFGLALKVATPPAGINVTDGTELVRHFLIEPSSKGVRLKGCINEPIFGTLAALVYQHSITALALPTKLLLPEYDPSSNCEQVSATQALLEQGAACNVNYLGSFDTESLTGPEALKRSVSEAFKLHKNPLTKTVSVHFKVSSQGITLTDNTRTLFFRRHHPVNTVSHAGIDPENRLWHNKETIQYPTNFVQTAKIFGFVARNPNSYDNQCHVFAELDPEQPASAVVNFITKVMMATNPKKY